MKDYLTIVPRRKYMNKKQLMEKVEAGLIPVVFFGRNLEAFYGFLLSREVDMSEVEQGQVLDLDYRGEILRAQFQNRETHFSGFRDYKFEIVDDGDFSEKRVPLHIHGVSVGEKKGANLYVVRESLTIRGLKERLPDKLELDVSSVDVNQKVFIRDLELPAGISCRPGNERDLVLECKFKFRDMSLLDAFQHGWMREAM